LNVLRKFLRHAIGAKGRDSIVNIFYNKTTSSFDRNRPSASKSY
jgi:hypothetical protein